MPFYPLGYEHKETLSDYMRLSEGEHKIRILTSPIIGFETWSEDNKPLRFKTFQEAVNSDSRDAKIKEFHTFIVWDYEAEMVRVLNITQKSIQTWIYNQTLDEDWADPTEYDIVIKRTGKGLNDTEYSLTAKLPKPLDKKIAEAFNQVKIDAEKYFEGGHPIVRGEETTSEVVSDQVDEVEDVADDVPF